MLSTCFLVHDTRRLVSQVVQYLRERFSCGQFNDLIFTCTIICFGFCPSTSSVNFATESLFQSVFEDCAVTAGLFDGLQGAQIRYNLSFFDVFMQTVRPVIRNGVFVFSAVQGEDHIICTDTLSCIYSFFVINLRKVDIVSQNEVIVRITFSNAEIMDSDPSAVS